MKFIAQTVCTEPNIDTGTAYKFALQAIGSGQRYKMVLSSPEPGNIEFGGRYHIEMKPVEQAEADKPSHSTATMIRSECGELAAMLVAKNQAYGDSALDPVRIFSQADPVEQIRVRLDDKLSRLARGQASGEDVILDLLGYLVLLRIAMRKGGGK